MIFLLLIILAFLLLQIQDQFNQPVAEERVPVDCPSCGEEVELDWMVCPHCLQRLRETCAVCEGRKMISHSFCTSCGSASAG